MYCSLNLGLANAGPQILSPAKPNDGNEVFTSVGVENEEDPNAGSCGIPTETSVSASSSSGASGLEGKVQKVLGSEHDLRERLTMFWKHSIEFASSNPAKRHRASIFVTYIQLTEREDVQIEDTGSKSGHKMWDNMIGEPTVRKEQNAASNQNREKQTPN